MQPPRSASAAIRLWQPDVNWWSQAAQSPMGLRRPDGTIITIGKTPANILAEMRVQFTDDRGLSADIMFAELPSPNAYAFQIDGRPKVVLGLGLITLLENDPDALRFVIAHEFAHVALGHVENNQRQKREEGFSQSGVVLGTVANLIVPFSGMLVNHAVMVVGRGFSRDEERTADQHALDWLADRAYSVCGAWRLTQKLRPMHSQQPLAMLSTHPSLEEREAAILQRAAARGESCSDGRSGRT